MNSSAFSCGVMLGEMGQERGKVASEPAKPPPDTWKFE